MSPRRPRIVVGLDGSERAEGVLAEAIALAEARAAELVLVRAVGIPIEMPAEALAMPPANLGNVLLEAAELELTRLAARVPPGISCSRRVRLGVAWEAVVEEARERHADLIVIGSHGYGGLDRILGTTAAKIVNHACCSTLVVRPAAPHAENQGSGGSASP